MFLSPTRRYLLRRTLLTLAAITLASVTSPIDARSGKPTLTAAQIQFWTRVAVCETGGNWRMHGSTYSGGVGFANTTWTLWAGALGLTRRYPYADQAPRLVQMRVAEYGYERGGYWGCLH